MGRWGGTVTQGCATHGWSARKSERMDDHEWFARSWVDPDSFAAPDSPYGGGGPGGFSHRQPLGSVPTPYTQGTAGVSAESDPVGFATRYAKRKVRAFFEDVVSAPTWDRLQYLAEVILGPYSFGIGVSVGLVKSPISDVVGILDLQKTFILADLYDRIQEYRSGNPLAILALGGPFSSVRLTAAGLLALGVLKMEDLKEAHATREKIKEELTEILRNPVAFLGALPGKIRDEYVAKWRVFQQLSRQSDLESQFKAGVMFGELLAEVILTLAGVVSGVGTAASIASKLPKLSRIANVFKRGRAGIHPGTGDAPSAKAPAPSPKSAPAAQPAPKLETRPPNEPVPAKPKKILASDLQKIDANGVKAERVREGSNGKVAIIGRSMDSYVFPYAAELEKHGYAVETFSGDLVPKGVWDEFKAAIEAKKLATGKPNVKLDDAEVAQTRMYQANEAWAQKLADDGYTVVDVGAPPGSKPSAFYEMEKATIFGDKP